MKPSPIPRIHKSLIRHTQELVSYIGATTGNHDIQYQAWDSRYEEDQLPKATLLGVEGFTFEENGGLWRVRYGLTLSTYQDRNQLEEIEIVGMIHEHTCVETKIPILDEATGEEFSQMHVSHWEIAPGVGTVMRNYRSIGIELLRAGE